MSAQTTYGYFTKKGVAGGIVDLSPYAIDTFLNAEDTAVMQFGLGVVAGDKAGTNVIKPVSGSTAATFEGITVNNRTTELGLEGGIYIKKGAAIGVMKYGRVYAQAVNKEGTPAKYGDAAYLIKTGDNAGCFTNDSTGTVAVKGVFKSAVENGIAVIELFHEAQ